MRNFNFKRILFIFILAALVWWNYHLFSYWSVINHDKSQFSKKQIEFKNLLEEISTIAPGLTRGEIFSKLEQLRANIYQNLRIKYSNAEMLGFIARSAAALNLNDIRPKIEKTKSLGKYENNTWEKTRLSINLRARYHEAARMINILERSPYLLKVLRYSIKRGSKDPTGPTYVTIIAEFYRLR